MKGKSYSNHIIILLVVELRLLFRRKAVVWLISIKAFEFHYT